MHKITTSHYMRSLLVGFEHCDQQVYCSSSSHKLRNKRRPYTCIPLLACLIPLSLLVTDRLGSHKTILRSNTVTMPSGELLDILNSAQHLSLTIRQSGFFLLPPQRDVYAEKIGTLDPEDPCSPNTLAAGKSTA